ncbi:unnamed protein product [Paramecium sonneborni]|uniref:Uncharacterized protein n=1 Tax=Paramecium sonneborni TaxID=65129 RepID=A0A8S1MQR5_9CILI|nr:unnamed protein product [Paramecium sonneborni]
MGRSRKNNKSQQTIEVNDDSKIQCNKIGKCKIKIKKSEIGKPRDLGLIQLDLPEIWSCSKNLVDILKFFIDEGRHFLLHLAGTKRSLETKQNKLKKKEMEQKQIEIKKKQPLFDFMEQFSVEFLGLPKRTKNKERIVVFFFRNNRVFNLKYSTNLNSILKNEKWVQILKDIYFIFDVNFYEELISILFLLEKNDDINFIVAQLIQEFLNTQNLLDIKVIFKNLLIQIIKDHIDHQLNYIGLHQLKSNEILDIYKKRIFYYQDRVIKLIKNIRTLFDNYNYEQVQNAQYEEDNYQNLDDEGYEYYEENQINQCFDYSNYD